MASSTQDNINFDDYSPSATLITFNQPIPLLRGPIPAGPTDDPNSGPFVLAFPNPKSFFSAFKSCESKLLEQCEAGVRIGCSLTASNNCRPPWWKTLLRGGSTIDLRVRNECEEREMAACLEKSKGKCVEFAREKCGGPFKWARVGVRKRKLREKEVGRLISCVCGLGVLNGDSRGLQMVFGDQLEGLFDLGLSYEVTNVRGSEILGDGYHPK